MISKFFLKIVWLRTKNYIFWEPLGVKSSNFQDCLVFMIATAEESLKAIWDVRVSISIFSGCFDMEWLLTGNALIRRANENSHCYCFFVTSNGAGIHWFDEPMRTIIVIVVLCLYWFGSCCLFFRGVLSFRDCTVASTI